MRWLKMQDAKLQDLNLYDDRTCNVLIVLLVKSKIS